MENHECRLLQCGAFGFNVIGGIRSFVPKAKNHALGLTEFVYAATASSGERWSETDQTANDADAKERAHCGISLVLGSHKHNDTHATDTKSPKRANVC